jgi:hypothetical protein
MRFLPTNNYSYPVDTYHLQPSTQLPPWSTNNYSYPVDYPEYP